MPARPNPQPQPQPQPQPHAAIPERDVLRRIVAMARERGALVRRLSYIGRAGAPDLLILPPGGSPLFVEVKRPVGGRLSPGQRAERDAWAAVGHVIHVARSAEDVEALLP